MLLEGSEKELVRNTKHLTSKSLGANYMDALLFKSPKILNNKILHSPILLYASIMRQYIAY